MQNKKFWNFTQGENISSLYLYGEIASETWYGDEVTPLAFAKELDECKGDLNIYIFSPGGDVFAGFAIYTMLSRYEGHVNVYIDGLAASAASVVAMAGDSIFIPENATMMIHNAWGIIAGNKFEVEDFRKQLELIDDQISQVYADRTGKDIEEIKQLMNAETWMSGSEAVNLGFATALTENKKIAAKIDLSVFDSYKHAPDKGAFLMPDVAEEHSEPLADIKPEIKDEGSALVEQRKMFNETKKKMYEVISK